MESHCLSKGSQRWVPIQNRKCGCGLKAKLKISKTSDNHHHLLFQCHKGTYHFFEWWKAEGEIPSLDGSELMDDSHNGGRISRHRVFNDVPYANLDRIDNDIERIVLRRLLALKANTGSNKMLLYVVIGLVLIIVLLLVGKKIGCCYVMACNPFYKKPYLIPIISLIIAFENSLVFDYVMAF